MKISKSITPKLVTIIRAVERLQRETGKPASLTAIAESIGRSKATVFEQLSRIEDAGLVDPAISAYGQKRVGYELTERAMELLQRRAMAGFVPVEGKITSGAGQVVSGGGVA